MACSTTCDPVGYLALNPDVAAHPVWSQDPCRHYNTFGQYDVPPRIWCIETTPTTIITLPDNFAAAQFVSEIVSHSVPLVTIVFLFGCAAVIRKLMRQASKV